MDLEEFDYLERLDDPNDADEGGPSADADEVGPVPRGADDEDEPAGEANPSKTAPDHFSREQLLAAYQDVERQLADKAREADDFRQLLMQMGSDTRQLRRQAEEESFLKEIRQLYSRDPVAATQMMLQKSQDDLWEAMEDRVAHSLAENREFNRLMDEFLSKPDHSSLKPFRDELEFLVREKGLHVMEASELLRKIAGKRDSAGRLRSAAAREIRNRSAVETGGEMGEPVDKDKEFYRVMKKAKNLDEMFAGLRRLKA